MDRFEVVLQPVHRADDRHRQDQRGNSGEDRAGHEVGTEDRRMPHRLDGHREDEGDDRVYRHRDRDDHHRHHGDERLEKSALPLGAAPTQGQHPVESAAQPRGVLTQDGDVGDQRKKEVDARRGEVGGDARHVPEQGRLEAAVLEHVENAVGPAHIDEDIAHSKPEDEDGDHFR